MAEDVVQASSPLDDRAQVRIFTLADYVAEEPSGKLYISGAGLEWTGVPARLEGDGTNQLISFYLIIRLAFPKASARERHDVEVRVVNRDGSPAGPDSLLKAELQFDLDHVPEDFSEVSGNLPVQITNYPISAEPNSVIFLNLLVDEVPVSR